MLVLIKLFGVSQPAVLFQLLHELFYLTLTPGNY